MRLVFLVDPLESLNLKKDTSYLLMQGAQRRGHDVFILYKDQISIENKEVFFHGFHIFLKEDPYDPFQKEKEIKLSSKETDVLLIRTDPPFDEEYVQLTWFLDLVQDDVFILNHPRGVRDVNEKIWTHHFPELIPKTLITANINEFHRFLSEHEKVVLKPTNAFGGKGVFITHKDDSNANVIFESVLEMSGYAMIQEYVPESSLGDKRILLLDGEVLGSIMRVHHEKDHRNNFSAGAKAEAAELTPGDERIIETLKPFLKEKKLHFTGIDILGDYLTEVNVTSPTCLREMNHIYDTRLEEKIIDFLEDRSSQR